MAAINPISAPTSAYSTDGSSTPISTRAKQQALGQQDFLKLLAVQFQSQDPMKPMDDTAFIAQMAQFTSLSQTETLTQQMTQMRTSQDLQTANSYIGRQLTVDAGDGKTVTGNVTAVDASGATPQLIINGQPFELSSVLRLELGATSAPAAPAA